MVEIQKQGKPSDQQNDEWQQDLNPNSEAGQNRGLESSTPEVLAPNAYDLKEVHRYLNGFADDELKRIKVVPIGTRLKQGATYIDLLDPNRKEFTAMGHTETEPDHWYVAKTEVDYPLWNRLTGVQNPDRIDESRDV